jgi:anthranilate synthase/aminodeoxychorismate synthase-like glutamine amidotransferase
MSILIVDNYDSFTYNLVAQVRRLVAPSVRVRVLTNDTPLASVGDAFDALILSPGPGNEHSGGNSLAVLESARARETPVLGVCLGHQLMAYACGGRVVRALRPVHGHRSKLAWQSGPLFRGIVEPFYTARYHSLVVCRESLPEELIPLAWTDGGELMAMMHRSLPWYGVQFHPESFMTDQGDCVVENFLIEAGILRSSASGSSESQ